MIDLTFKFEVEKAYYSSGSGAYKKGHLVKIVQRYSQNGFHLYVDSNGVVHREIDLIGDLKNE